MDKFNVIYSDPPWRVKSGRPFAGYKMIDGKQIFNSTDNKSRKLAYPSMTVDEIAALNVKELAADNAHLYLWVINKYLLQAEKIINAWGFKYSTTLVWTKNAMGGAWAETLRSRLNFYYLPHAGT